MRGFSLSSFLVQVMRQIRAVLEWKNGGDRGEMASEAKVLLCESGPGVPDTEWEIAIKVLK